MSWFIFPVKTRDVLRRRIADALAVLTDYLTAARRLDPTRLIEDQARFDYAVAQLDQIAAPIAAQHWMIPRKKPDCIHPVDAITPYAPAANRSMSSPAR